MPPHRKRDLRKHSFGLFQQSFQILISSFLGSQGGTRDSAGAGIASWRPILRPWELRSAASFTQFVHPGCTLFHHTAVTSETAWTRVDDPCSRHVGSEPAAVLGWVSVLSPHCAGTDPAAVRQTVLFCWWMCCSWTTPSHLLVSGTFPTELFSPVETILMLVTYGVSSCLSEHRFISP